MRIEFHLEENEAGLPIEIANALIQTKVNNANYEELEAAKKELSEIAEHIQVFIKYWQ